MSLGEGWQDSSGVDEDTASEEHEIEDENGRVSFVHQSILGPGDLPCDFAP